MTKKLISTVPSGNGEKRSAAQKPQRFILIFYSRSFIIFSLPLRSMAQFDLVLIHDVVHMKVHFLYLSIQLVKPHLLKNLPSIH